MRLIKNKTLFIKIIGFPQKEKNTNQIRKYGMFISGTLLAMSEYLPFSSIKGNGILDVIKKIREEYNSNLK